MSVKQILGNNIRTFRKLNKLSQEDFAEKLNISVKHLSTLETGKVFASAELIEKISILFKIPVSFLFADKNETTLNQNDISIINTILDEEIYKTIDNIKTRIALTTKIL